MRSLIALAAAAVMTTGCVIIVDGDDGEDGYDGDSFRMDLVASGPFTAAETHDLSSFTRVSASAGTDVTVIYGDNHEIRLNQRAVQRTSYKVQGDKLEITCKRPCGNGNRGEVEVVTPSLTALSVSSGARLEVEDGFAATDTMSFSASSGGNLRAADIETRSASASASSGGSVYINVSDSLQASASSGGSIRYEGSPEAVSESKSSGGSIRAR